MSQAAVGGAGAGVRAVADRLREERVPFVTATVVRAERPTSAKPGDEAVITADGEVVGFVGGQCSEASVAAQALEVLRTGEATLLNVTPEGDQPAPAGTVNVHNPCQSGGTLEIFLQPWLPPPLVAVHGTGPIADALVALATHLEWAVTGTAGGVPASADAVVVASHGRGEQEVLGAALAAGVPYVGLVASRRRGAAVLAALDGTAGAERVHTPAGLDIGARHPGEVAVSILAEIISSRPRQPRSRPEPTGGAVATTVVDPVCGMTVVGGGASPYADHAGQRRWFCGSGCRDAFVADPTSFGA